jgi:AraC-like DNA-binding protein
MQVLSMKTQSRTQSKNSHQIRYVQTVSEHLDVMQAFSNRSFPRHTHDLYGIGLILHGGHRSISDAGQVQAGPGELITVNPGEVHDGHSADARGRSWNMLYIAPSMLHTALADMNDDAHGEFYFTSPAFSRPGAVATFQAAMTLATQKTPCVAGVFEQALQALLMVLGVRKPICNDTQLSRIMYAKQKLDDDPSSPVSMAELAQISGMSRFALYRAFSTAFHLSPQAYLLQRRLFLARNLLRKGWRVSDVAHEAGFSDQSHLHRHFLKQFGVTPGAYACRDTRQDIRHDT